MKLFKVTEEGYVSHWIFAKNKKQAIDFLKKHLKEQQSMLDSEIEDTKYIAEDLTVKKVTIDWEADGDLITLKGSHWVKVLRPKEEEYLACSEY